MRGFWLISFGILQSLLLMSCAGGNKSVPCGNGIVDLEETCDDGNRTSGDGCSRECQTESGYICSGAPSRCVKSCGNGTIDPGEACDDGYMSATCNDDCTLARCGDGILNSSAGEACDDGDTDNDNDCSNTCQVNFICSSPFSTTFAGGNG